MHVWIAFEAGDPLGEKFVNIKEALGVNSKAEVIRYLIKQYPLHTEGDAL